MLKIVATLIGLALMGLLGGMLLGLMLAPLFPKGLPAPLAILALLVATGILIWWAAGLVMARRLERRQCEQQEPTDDC
jgi:membrane protein implicated in regulation of membrane protease activity